MGCASSNSFVAPQNQVDDIWVHFDKKKMLGRGASGEVWLATEKKSNKKFAVKFLDKADPANETMFEHEASMLRLLSHPNILAYHDCYEARTFRHVNCVVSFEDILCFGCCQFCTCWTSNDFF
jgi:serine/threonine protein kinase